MQQEDCRQSFGLSDPLSKKMRQPAICSRNFRFFAICSKLVINNVQILISERHVTLYVSHSKVSSVNPRVGSNILTYRFGFLTTLTICKATGGCVHGKDPFLFIFSSRVLRVVAWETSLCPMQSLYQNFNVQIFFLHPNQGRLKDKLQRVCFLVNSERCNFEFRVAQIRFFVRSLVFACAWSRSAGLRGAAANVLPAVDAPDQDHESSAFPDAFKGAQSLRFAAQI